MPPQTETSSVKAELAPSKPMQRSNIRPVPVVPIVPAVPLAFERKPKPKQSEIKPVVNGATSITPPSSTAPTDGQQEVDMPAIVDDGPMIVNGSTHSVESGVERDVELPVGANLMLEASTDLAAQHFDQDVSRTHSSTVNPGHINSAPLHSAYQVPPPFQPTHYPSAPSSAGSSTFPPYPPHFNHIPLHHPHPRNGNLVFGGYAESNNPSPAPHVPVSAPAYPPHFSTTSVNPHFQPPSYPFRHAHNGSDPPAPFVYPHQPQQYNHQSGAYHPVRLRNNVASGPQRRVPSFHAPAEHSPFSPSGTPVNDLVVKSVPRKPVDTFSDFAEINGLVLRATPPLICHSSHGSQDSSVEEDQRESPVFESAQLEGEPSYQNGTNTYTSNHDLGQNSAGIGQTYRDDSHLTDYLRSMFGDLDLADYIIEITHNGGRLGNCRFFVHGVLAARSPTIKQHMRWLLQRLTDADCDYQQRKIIRLVTADNFLRYDAFELALKRLYGHCLLHDDHLAISSMHGGFPDDREVSARDRNEERVRFALAYAAAGHLLQLYDVTSAGVKLVSESLAWETIERALAFAMDGLRDIVAISTASMPVQSLTETGADMEAFGEDRSTNPAVPVSADQPKPLTAVFGAFATYAPFSQELLRDILDFITSEFPPLFELDTEAPQLMSFSRLPATVETRSPTSSSRLSMIQFGDYPSQDTGRPSFETALLSKLLLSLPLPLLKHVLESKSLGEPHSPVPRDTRLHIAETVIAEREKRRLKALKSKLVSNEHREANKGAWSTVGWEENVETIETDPVIGFQLVRNWKGFHNPDTSNMV